VVYATDAAARGTLQHYRIGLRNREPDMLGAAGMSSFPAASKPFAVWGLAFKSSSADPAAWKSVRPIGQ
jgi:hypothetical protein